MAETVDDIRADGMAYLPEARRYSPEFMEQQRALFEAEIRAHWPNRSLQRWGNTYWKTNTRNQWLGWLACARAAESRKK